jgi:hypothetical protein
MQPIPELFDSINRNAIVIKPRRPLFDWINKIYPDSPVASVEEGSVYLIKEKSSNEQIANWIKKNFDQIFQNELNGWHTDDEHWPRNRTFEMFQKWFDFDIHSMIWDLEEIPVTKH